MDNTMDTITVNKNDLIAKLSENRNKHQEAYVESEEGYREEVIKELKSKLKTIKAGGEIDLNFDLPKPYSHTEEYNTAIGMLEWSTEDQIRLTRANYENFVLDKWSWSSSFAMTSGLYNKK